jgi:hypothetical protein
VHLYVATFGLNGIGKSYFMLLVRLTVFCHAPHSEDFEFWWLLTTMFLVVVLYHFSFVMFFNQVA